MSIKQLAIGMTACAFVCSTQIAQAEEQIIEIEGVASGLLYANYTIWDCCDLNSFSANGSSITVGNCATLGGYCSAGKRIASWMFPLPSFPENATLISASFEGRHNGGSANFEFRSKWFSSSSHGYTTALAGWNSPNFTGNAGSTGGNFSTPLQIELTGGEWNEDYLLLSVYRSSDMTFYNSGTLRPTIRLMVNVPDTNCQGDINDDDAVNITDLLTVIAGWDEPYNVSDLLTVIEHWDSSCK